jgi:hypothetical protein
MRNIQHSRQVIVGGKPGRRMAIMLPMNATKFACGPLLKATLAPEGCTDRQRRLAAVKFMALPEPIALEAPATPLSRLLSRVFGFLAVARR